MRTITKYIRDPFSSISHFVAAILSIVGLVLLLIEGINTGSMIRITAYTIFGSSMILLYVASTIYHSFVGNKKIIKIFRKIDHMMINVLIAGTYTPFCLLALPQNWGLPILSVIYVLAILGVIMAIFWINAPRWLTTLLFIVMGWICVIAIYPLVKTVPVGAAIYLFLGGFSYTLGAIIYALKKPNIWPNIVGFHGVWHLFVMGGTIFHFFSIYMYL